MTDDLKTLINSLTGTSTASRLRKVMPEIEQKLGEGVKHEEIILALAEAGLVISMATFRGNLYRYRRNLNPGAKAEVPMLQPLQALPVASDLEFEAALDPGQRARTADAYTNLRPPLPNKKRNQS